MSMNVRWLARAARRTRELVTDAEVFLLENIAQLRGLGPRVTLTQIAEAAQQLESQLPVRMKSSISDGDQTTDLEEEAAFPIGGFSSISTVGNLENLVTSELIYMDEAGAERPDLFDIRFVEGELLYYARDESVAVRRRRTVVLVLDASLASARLLEAGEKFQQLVWALATCASVVRRLAGWLDSEAVKFEIIATKKGNDSPLAEELGVLGLLLREFRERGQLEVREAESVAAALELVRGLHPGRLQTVVFETAAQTSTGADLRIEVGAKPKLGAVPSSWPEVAREILEHLVGTKRRSAA
jgi:vWA domain found in the FtsH ternary systems